jgi:plasmid replication initiation protein
MEQKPANTSLRSQCSLRLYSWAKKYVQNGAQTISLGELRRVSALSRSMIRKETSLRKRLCPSGRTSGREALDVAIAEISAKTDLKLKLASIERSKHRRVVALNFTIKTQPETPDPNHEKRFRHSRPTARLC